MSDSRDPLVDPATENSLERKVIILYKNNPFLWKKAHPRYSDSKLKKYALEEIAIHLKMTNHALVSKIKSISKTINQIAEEFTEAEANGGVVVLQSRYEYFTDCQFLFDEFLWRKRKSDEAKQRATSTTVKQRATSTTVKQRATSTTVKQSVNERLLCESWIFSMVMDHYIVLGATEDNQINWDEISLFVSAKTSYKISPAIAKKIWMNLSKSILESFRQTKIALNEEHTGSETVWEALEKLVHFSGMILLSLYVKSILQVYVKKAYTSKFEDNQFLFDLICKYPNLMKNTKKGKKGEKENIWNEITKSYNRKTSSAIQTTLLRRQWCQLLRKIERRMRIFRKSLREGSSAVNICAPTDLEKNILKYYPRLLLSSFHPSSITSSDSKDCVEDETSDHINEDVGNSEDVNNFELTDTHPTNEEKASWMLEIIDISVGDGECADLSEISEEFLDDLEIKNIMFGINNQEDQLSDEDVSFLLVKWLVSNLKLKEYHECNLSSYDTSSGIWERIAEKFLPFSSSHSPKSLYSRWRGIFIDTIYNLQSDKRSPTDMTSMDWLVLQSFPNLFTEKVEESEDQHSNDDFLHTSVDDSSQSPSPVPQSNKNLILQTGSNHCLEINRRSAVDEDDRSRDSNRGCDTSDMNLEQSLCNTDLPELKRHQKPIILSNKTDVLKMNQQLKTASVAPSRSVSPPKSGRKCVILEKSYKGCITDIQLLWTRKNYDKYRPSYRPNPKFSKDIPDWMKKTKVAVDDTLPVVTLARKEDAAYQHFLKLLQKFSKSKTFTSKTKAVHRVTNDEIFTSLALQGTEMAAQKVVYEPKDIDISDSDDNSDDMLDFSKEINASAEKKILQKRPRKGSLPKNKSVPMFEADEDGNSEILYTKDVSNAENSKIVVTSGVLSDSDNNSDWSVNKKPMKRTRKLQYKKPVKKQMKLARLAPKYQPPESEIMQVIITDVAGNPVTVPVSFDEDDETVNSGALLSDFNIVLEPSSQNQDESNNSLSDNIVLSLDMSQPLLGASLKDSADPIPPPTSDAVSQLPEPSNLDLRSYYSMMADSLLDMANLDDVEIDKSKEIDTNPATDVSEKLTDVDKSPDALCGIKTTQPPKVSVETITLSDSDDDVPLAHFTRQGKK